MTPGELLAKKLRGDNSISNADIERATEKFFNDSGCNCKCTIEVRPQDIKEGEQLRTTGKGTPCQQHQFNLDTGACIHCGKSHSEVYE